MTYLLDTQDGLTWEKVLSAVFDISQTGWDQHPGYRDIEILNSFADNPGTAEIEKLSPHLKENLNMLKGRKSESPLFIEVDRMIDYCIMPGCPEAYISNPKKKRLRSMFPVICSGCCTLSLIHI